MICESGEGAAAYAAQAECRSSSPSSFASTSEHALRTTVVAAQSRDWIGAI
jgi:hypothetical protein